MWQNCAVHLIGTSEEGGELKRDCTHHFVNVVLFLFCFTNGDFTC